MKRSPITETETVFPKELSPLLCGARLYDSSCSREARVVFIDKDGGYYLKSSACGSLKSEAEMTSFFHSKGLGAEVLYYGTDMGKDWLLTSRVRGEDCTLREHLDEPERLCDLLSSALRELHESDSAGCPVQNRNEGYFATVDSGYRRGVFDGSYLLPAISAMNAREAYALTAELRGRFKNDALLHGDYCLPNVMLDGWRVSGFIDLGNGGIGDRHIDIEFQS